MESPADSPLSDGELDRLDELLAALPDRHHALSRDRLQGFCAAAAMGPDAALPDDWLEVVLGPTAARSASAELVLLMERFRSRTIAAVDAGTLAIEARTTRTGRVHYTDWCQGFLDGVEVSPTEWFAVADPDELADILFPIDVIAGALPDRERAAYKASEWRELVRQSEDSLSSTITRLTDYWSIVRAPPVTVRRAQPKVGRNEPCPCGSGRKFKQCHGAS